MTVKGRPEKRNTCEKHKGKNAWSCPHCAADFCYNEAIDADTEYFVSVLEGILMPIDEKWNRPKKRIVNIMNARIEGAIKSVKEKR